MQANWRRLVAAATMGCAACVTPQRLAPATRELKVVDVVRPNCAYLGLAVGASHPSSAGSTLFYADAVTEDARNRAMNVAADMGATHLVLGDPRREEGTTYFTARAYRCEARASPPPAPPLPAAPPAEPGKEPEAAPGCAKDADCKGDRICEAGTCVDPASGRGCAKDTDCKGDRVCEAGNCVNPRPAPPSTSR